jgi:hypothetical protein
MAKSAGITDYHIEAREVHLLKSPWIKREQRLMIPAGHGYMLKKRGTDVPFLKVSGHGCRIINRGENRRIGIQMVKHLQNALRSTHLIEPVVDNRDSQTKTFLKRQRQFSTALDCQQQSSTLNLSCRVGMTFHAALPSML